MYHESRRLSPPRVDVRVGGVSDGRSRYIQAFRQLFQSVNHKLLLHKLQNSFHIEGHALQWFVSYLSGRTQRVALKVVCRLGMNFPRFLQMRLRHESRDKYVIHISKTAFQINSISETPHYYVSIMGQQNKSRG